ncbi:MAG: acetyl-CoA carboxylase biotin carboxyl carrier protein, partial [Endomicrobiia bacterium]|nr:acetyl-CoA carboxylase biotin carboxyl carrier protein [Endomicrobiia bacterium]
PESKIAPAAGPSGKSIASPINGVFYRSSSPKSSPFVSEGDTVEPGKTLCVIEAMKVMNEIKADSRARILKILVENGVSVNQGQPIFIVDY